MSKKRQREAREYSKKRKAFLALHPFCMAYHSICAEWRLMEGQPIPSHWPQEAPPSEEVHHRAHRGKNYLNENTWLACSAWAHRWIHDHPKAAYSLGLMVR
jgi:hypothetical protein